MCLERQLKLCLVFVHGGVLRGYQDLSPIIKDPKVAARHIDVQMPLVGIAANWGTLTASGNGLLDEDTLESVGADEEDETWDGIGAYEEEDEVL